MIFDSHTHLVFSAFNKDREKVIERIRKEGFFCIEVGTCYKTSKKAVELAQNNKNIFAAVGLHPFHIRNEFLKLKRDKNEGEIEKEDFDEKKYLELAANKKVVAIGEIGLDYYYRPKTKLKQEKFKEKQKEVFIRQLNFALSLGLPIIFHCRMAHQDLIQILKDYSCEISGVVHCFTGTLEEMEEYLKMGFYIGFNGIIFKLDLKEAIKNCPLNRIVVETDCPYLTPPQEGEKRNEPIFTKYIIQEIAKIKNLPIERIVQETTQNCQKLFHINS